MIFAGWCIIQPDQMLTQAFKLTQDPKCQWSSFLCLAMGFNDLWLVKKSMTPSDLLFGNLSWPGYARFPESWFPRFLGVFFWFLKAFPQSHGWDENGNICCWHRFPTNHNTISILFNILNVKHQKQQEKGTTNIAIILNQNIYIYRLISHKDW